MESEFSEHIRQKLEVITDIDVISKIFKELPELGDEIYKLAFEGRSLAKRIIENKEKIEKYLEISRKLKISPDELIDLLIIPDLPIKVGVGKKFVEGVVGFKGLGIETIDHHLEEFNYENISDNSEEELKKEVSITTIMYRIPPYMLTTPDKLPEVDRRINDIVGNRFVWLIRPKGLEKRKWARATRSVKPIIHGDAQFTNGIWIPSKITLVDLIDKCIIIETPWLNLKFGSEKISRKINNLTNKTMILSELRRLRSETAAYKTIQRWGLRFDYVYFCYWGRGLSTDPFDVKCPFKNCNVRKEGVCDGVKLWSGKYEYRKPFPKVYPLRDSQFQNDGTEIYKESLPGKIVDFTAYDYRHVHNYWYGIEFGAWFIRSRPIIRLFFGDEKYYFKIGYSIPTSVMEFSFDDSWLDKVILTCLSKNADLRKSLALKYVFNQSLGRTFEYGGLADLIEDLLNKGENYETYRKIKDKKFERDFIIFCKQVFMHTFKHLLSQFILKDLLGVEFSFVIPKYYYNSGKYPNNVNRVLIAENAKNGRIGIVDTVIKKIEEIGLAQFIMEFCNFATSYLKQHAEEFDRIDERRKEEARKSLEIAKSRISDKDKLQRLERIEKVTETLKERLSEVDVELDSTLARLYLLTSGDLDDRTLIDLEDYFDDILDYHGFRICVDGCNACVRLERVCSEGSGQITTTSRTTTPSRS